MTRRSFLRLLSAAAPAADHVPDADLLRRFAAARDAAAFELLVRHHRDAEDAFQAAFLVLARNAGSGRGASAGGWLHRGAVNDALKLKAGRDRRGAAVRGEAGPRPDGRGPPDPVTDKLAAAVHQELAWLPD